MRVHIKMKYIDLIQPIPISNEPTTGIWYRHQSPFELQELRPMTYYDIRRMRPDYDVSARHDTEEVYRAMSSQATDTSFLYATIVGFHKMETPLEYPGFTYYFKMTDYQIQQCVFDVVSETPLMNPMLGHSGIIAAKHLWEQHQTDLHSFDTDDMGMIDPRVEVIIPFAVKPLMFVPQEEDR